MDPATEFRLESPAFRNRSEIPSEYTCDGQDVPPPLRWSDAPAETKSFALIVDDPDAPDPAAPQRTWVHWLVYNIPADTRSLNPDLPDKAHFGVNDFKKTAWGGPCPPKGVHRYFYKLYALDTNLDFPKAPTKKELEVAMKGHILAHTELVGLYGKQSPSH